MQLIRAGDATRQTTFSRGCINSSLISAKNTEKPILVRELRYYLFIQNKSPGCGVYQAAGQNDAP